MKVTVVGSHLCPDVLYSLNRLTEAKVKIEFKNISSSLADLRFYLNLRENNPLYDDIRCTSKLGIPCFILEDGTMTLELDEVLK